MYTLPTYTVFEGCSQLRECCQGVLLPFFAPAQKEKKMCLLSTLRKSVIYGMLAEIDISPNGGARNAVALFDRHVTAGLTEVH